MSEKFSQNWQVYRIAMHPKGGMDLALKMSTCYSTRQFRDVVEMLDIYDALLEQEKAKNKKTQGE